MNTAGITAQLEDHGQDFLEFDIKDGRIVAARPFQSTIWNGLEVLNETIEPGDYIAFRCRDSTGIRTLRYPVVSIRPLV
ncbi:hypothetical protein ACKAVU_16325 [Acinetobacter baumannii]